MFAGLALLQTTDGAGYNQDDRGRRPFRCGQDLQISIHYLVMVVPPVPPLGQPMAAGIYPQTKPSSRDQHTDCYPVGTLGTASINKSPLELQLLPCKSKVADL